MKKLILCVSFLGLGSQGFAFESDPNAVQPAANKDSGISSSSSSLFQDVECDMADYTCAKLVLDLGQQEALMHIGNPEQPLSEILVQAISIYKSKDATASNLSDDQIINLLAAGQHKE